MDEAHPLNPETPYAAAKVAQDKYVFSYGRTFNMPWVTMRPFNMYGPNSHWQGFRGELIPKMIVRAMNKIPLVIFGDGSQTRDFIYVDDVAEAVVSLLENPQAREMEINFCSGKETTIKRIAELVCENFSLDKSEFIKYESQRPGDVQRHLGDNSKYKQILNLSPKVDIESGIKNTVKWFKSLPFTSKELLEDEILKSWE
jgi:UDP-glucose 4-epimerase